MKRKLINFEAFDRLQKDSLSAAEVELKEAESILAKALEVDDLQLLCFGQEHAVYEASDGTYIHASFLVEGQHIIFENVEQLVVDEASEQEETRKTLTKLVDAILENEKEKSDQLFSEYITSPSVRRSLNEERKLRTVPIRKNGKTVGYRKARWQTTPRHSESPSSTAKRMRGKLMAGRKLSPGLKKQRKLRRERIRRQIGEWTNLCENVLNYLDYKEMGPSLANSLARHDELGNVVAVRVPTVATRNEAKLLSFNWKTMNTDSKTVRGKAKKMHENLDFCKAIAGIKRNNALADDSAFEESLENFVTKYPESIYLTQAELANSVKLALETAGSMNFDDATCSFIAEGILRTAHKNFIDTVSKIVRLAGGEEIAEGVEDKYAEFQKVVDKFYPSLDESSKLEMQAVIDIYNALRQVYDAAHAEDNKIVKSECASHLNELAAIVQQEVEPSQEVFEAAVAWLIELVETNLEGSSFDYSNTPHQTVNGDHPQMAKNASKGYTPSSDFSGNWGHELPASDGKNYKGSEADDMKNAWAGSGGEGQYPDLTNPYVPKPYGDFKIKGEKHVDADSGQLAHWSAGDTWPALQNPYVPSPADVFTAKSDNLVVEK
jgi:hypothetical protein